MRELRQDEIELIERVRKRDSHMVTAIKKLTLGTNRMIKVYGDLSQNIPVPVEDLPQEDTLDQIKRMVDHLPDHDGCDLINDACPFKGDLLISKWAREYLKQMIRGEEGRRP